jgi:hypothetical protein
LGFELSTTYSILERPKKMASTHNDMPEDPYLDPVQDNNDNEAMSTISLQPPERNPFSSVYGSAPASAATSVSGFHRPIPFQSRSRRIKKGTTPRPWLDEKPDPREKWVTIIPCFGLLVGVAVAAILVWNGIRQIQNHVYCPVYETDFSTGLDGKVWTKEVEVGGYG